MDSIVWLFTIISGEEDSYFTPAYLISCINMHVCISITWHRRIVEFFLNVTEVTIGVCQINKRSCFFLFVRIYQFYYFGGKVIFFMNDMEL